MINLQSKKLIWFRFLFKIISLIMDLVAELFCEVQYKKTEQIRKKVIQFLCFFSVLLIILY
ncbi:hypothetical protein BpHYR1_054025 [Brachionus plicatilis]|uniref:Uncharacterized protein n=1 Tax=Brachionus plicatilis TaxID=10195 RepID=A0A3M7P4S1_BRAPC|nr:hypothetical protein BpHYR1_054025 [Brachionus plicatilis]